MSSKRYTEEFKIEAVKQGVSSGCQVSTCDNVISGDLTPIWSPK